MQLSNGFGDSTIATLQRFQRIRRSHRYKDCDDSTDPRVGGEAADQHSQRSQVSTDPRVGGDAADRRSQLFSTRTSFGVRPPKGRT